MNNCKRFKKVSTPILIKSSFWYTASSFLTKAIGFLTTPFFTRILTKEEIGDFANYTSWQSIFVIVCSLEIYSTINRARFDYAEENQLDSYISSCLSLSSLITLVLFAIYLLLPNVFYQILLIDHKYILIMFVYLFTIPAFSMFQAKKRIEYEYKINAILSFAIAISSAVLAVILSKIVSLDRLLGRVVGQYILYIVAGALFYVYFIKKSHFVRFSYYKYALYIGLPLVFSSLGSSILLSSDSIIVKHMCSGEQVGYLTISHTCAHIILILVQTLNHAWSPWFYDKLNEAKCGATRIPLLVFLWIILAGTFGVLLVAPEIIVILGGSQYMEATYILPANIMSGIYTAITLQFINLETYYKKPQYAAIITGCAAIINLGLAILGVMLIGYEMVCYVTLLCQIIMICVHYRITLNMGIRTILGSRDLILFVLLPLLVIPVALFMYHNNTIRWGCIVTCVMVVGILLIIKREDIKMLVTRYIVSS